jgi:hypothetical protein
MTPTEPHEMRDVWEDIEKGARQLARARAALLDPGRRQSYLAGWFPGSKTPANADMRIVTCVISSHRIFSGLEIEGVAVRD